MTRFNSIMLAGFGLVVLLAGHGLVVWSGIRLRKPRKSDAMTTEKETGPIDRGRRSTVKPLIIAETATSVFVMLTPSPITRQINASR